MSSGHCRPVLPAPAALPPALARSRVQVHHSQPRVHFQAEPRFPALAQSLVLVLVLPRVLAPDSESCLAPVLWLQWKRLSEVVRKMRRRVGWKMRLNGGPGSLVGNKRVTLPWNCLITHRPPRGPALHALVCEYFRRLHRNETF